MGKEIELTNTDCNKALEGLMKENVLTNILVRCGEETITDEQVQRVLVPVLNMIYEGRFDRQSRKN